MRVVVLSELNDVARSSVRGSFFLFLGMSSSTIIMALTSIFIARLLGPEDYGLYTVIFIIPNLFIAFTDLGISPALTKFSAQLHIEGRDKETAHFIKVGIFSKLIFTFIISLSLFLTSEKIATHILHRQGTSYLIRIAILTLFGQAVLETVVATLIGLDETDKGSVLINIQAVVKAITSPLLIFFGLSVAGALLGTGLGFVIAASSGAIMLLLHTCDELERNREKSENISFSKGLYTLIYYGIPLYFSTLIYNLQFQIKSIFLALFSSNMSIGNYKTAKNFIFLINLLIYPISKSLFPAFSKLNINNDRSSIQKMFKLSVKYTSLLVIPTSIAISILSKNIVYVIYGSQYQFAPTYLSIYMLGFLCTAIGRYVNVALFNSQGDTRTTFKLQILNFSLSIPLAFILINIYDVMGLIISIIISELISSIYGIYQVKTIYNINFEVVSSIKTIMVTLLSAFLVCIFFKYIYLINPIFNLILGGILYIMSFLVFAPVLGVINKEDIEYLGNMLKELPFIYPLIRYILIVEKKILELNINQFRF